ncbi:SHOCT domain-containing protein [Hominicoprocola fusiformis]
MIDAKKELQYRLAVRMLEHLSEKGLLTATELAYAKKLAREKYRPQTVWE